MAAQPLAEQVGVVPACQALGVSRANVKRSQHELEIHRVELRPLIHDHSFGQSMVPPDTVGK